MPLDRVRAPGAWRQSALLGFCWLLCFVAGPARGDGLLDPLQGTAIGRVETFVAAEAFTVGNKIGGRTLSAVGLNFTAHFLGVVETNLPPVALLGWELRYTMGDRSVIKAVGGERNAVVPFLACVYRMMEMGEAGVGHTDWRSNFAYVRSPVDQRLWAVHWTVNYANEWNIGAVYVPHEALDWRSGSRVFTNGGEPEKILVDQSHVRAKP